jgi:uncharacterized small protein (DUF1192 family)
MALDTDDIAPPPKPKPQSRELQTLSVAELEGYVEELEAEILRAKAAIAAKRDHRSGAEALFKKR